jgi:hypothetical protein
MPKISYVRFVRYCAVRMLVLAVVLLSPLGAFAATDWSGIQAAMGTDGYVFPGDVLRFQLARRENISVDGAPPLPGHFAAAVSNGFVAFKQKRGNDFFADGALPAKESEVSALEDSLLGHGRAIRITAIYSHVTNISPKLIWVHFEATGPGVELATWLADALVIIQNPQLGGIFIPGTNNVIDPPAILPPPILDLFNQGFLAQVDNIFAFWLPRPDECSISLDSRVKAQSGLGVGQTFYIQVDFSGGADITINIDFALRTSELPAVQSILRSGGFTLPSLSNNYVSDTPRLHYLHATASGNGIVIGATLFKAIQVIGRGDGNGGNGGGCGNGGGNGGGNGDGDHDGDDH